jgi:ferrochelatase
LVANAGSPDAPEPFAVRRYLSQFLGDRRVIEFPGWLWLPLLHGIILTVRPWRSARLYRRIWTEAGSPLVVNTQRIAAALQISLNEMLGADIQVVAGFRYGHPSIANGLRTLAQAGVERMVVLPLFPQYSATTSAAVFDAVFRELQTWRKLPELRTVTGYAADPGYIAALARRVQESWLAGKRARHLLISFHSIPQSYVRRGDPYQQQCQLTAERLAQTLNLPDNAWQLAYQSRFGPQEWLRPYTVDVLKSLGNQKAGSLQVVCPGFAADCLETLDEIVHEGRQIFEQAGGAGFEYIPALNDHPQHIQALAGIVRRALSAW